jgi:lysophospholipase L1-like esterase
VLSLSGVSVILWTEGINDLASGVAVPEAVAQGMQKVIAAIRVRFPRIRVVIGTVPSSLGGPGNYGTPETDAKRAEFNRLLRTAQFWDGLVDFDRATIDLKTGELKREFAIGNPVDGAGDKLHPNRAGYIRMGRAISFEALLGPEMVRTALRH